MTTQSDGGGSIEAAALPAAALSPYESFATPSGALLAVDDKELGVLMKQKALPIVLAAVFCGLFFGTALQAGDAMMAALFDGVPVTPSALFYVVVSCLSLGIGLSAMAVALVRRWQVLQVLEAIRKRSRNGGNGRRR